MLVSLFTLGTWLDQPRAAVKSGVSSNIWYLSLPAPVIEGLPKGHGALRIALDGVEGLAVSPLGPSDDGHSMEFIVVMPSAEGARRMGQVV